MDKPTTPDIAIPNVVLMLEDQLPSKPFLSDFFENIADPALVVDWVRTPRRPAGAIEYYHPTAVALFIDATYFSHYVAQNGMGHVRKLADYIKYLWEKSRDIKLMGLDAESDGVHPPRRFDVRFSIIFDVSDIVRFKYLLTHAVDSAEADRCIKRVLNYIRDLHDGTTDPVQLRELLSRRPVMGTILVTCADDGSRMVLIDPSE